MARLYTSDDRTAEFEMLVKQLSAAEQLHILRFMKELNRLRDDPQTAQMPAQELARMVAKQITS